MVRTTGDGLLAEFASVVDAVKCSVALQEGMAERNADIPEARSLREIQPRYRVGSMRSVASTDRMEAIVDALREAGLPE